MNTAIFSITLSNIDPSIYSAIGGSYGALAIASHGEGQRLHTWVYAISAILHALMAVCH